MIITYVKHPDELHQILAVQNENHFSNLSSNSKKEKGYVTVKHSFETLCILHTKALQVIAKDSETIVGFALVMLKECKALIPELLPLFKAVETIRYKAQSLSETNYYVMGQICVKDGYKRKGLFIQLYHKHRTLFSKTYDHCVTVVSTRNTPSLLAHKKVGFKTIDHFLDEFGEWQVMLWDWN